MEQHKHINDHLSSGEVASLWNGYQYESIHRCGITFFLNHVEDQSIEELLKDALILADKRIEQMKELFLKFDLFIPQAFGDGDVNLEAPRLFSDILYLHYILHTIILETTIYNEAKKEAVHDDLIEYFSKTIHDTVDFGVKAKRCAREKGAFIPSPPIPKQTEVQYVKKDSFLTGWFGDKRPLLGIEISHLISNARMNALGQAVITAFSQVAKLKEVRSYFEKGRELSGKHLDIFTKFLRDDNLPNPSMLLTAEVTNSREAPFSDKLMTVFITKLIAISIGSYGISIATSPRRDLGLMYTQLVADIAKYANEGSKLLIQHGWMEQPPIAASRKDLAK